MPLGQFSAAATFECFDCAQRRENLAAALVVGSSRVILVPRAVSKAQIWPRLNAQLSVLGAILAAFEAAQTA